MFSLSDLLNASEAVFGLVMLLILLKGLLIMLFGYQLHRLVVWLVGAAFGGGFILLIQLIFQEQNMFWVLLFAIGGGFVALAVEKGIVFLIGALISAVLLLLAGVSDPLTLGILAAVGGLLAIEIYIFLIVIASAAVGAFTSLFAVLNLLALSQGGGYLVVPSVGSYLWRVLWNFSSQGTSPGVQLQQDVLLWLLLFSCGVFSQLYIHYKGIPLPFIGRKRSVEIDTDTDITQPPNGKAITAPPPLSQPAEAQLAVSRGRELANAIRENRLYLTLYQQQQPVRTLLLKPGCYRVGREHDCDIAVPNDDDMSRHHLTVEVSNEKVQIKDENSTNGVLRAGRDPIQQMRIALNDWFVAGQTEFLFHTQNIAD